MKSPAKGSSGSCELKRFPRRVDRSLWDMTPQTVNAEYEPTMNQITVPAAILQPPFFDANADPAVNYAETGATTWDMRWAMASTMRAASSTRTVACATGGPRDRRQIQGQG